MLKIVLDAEELFDSEKQEFLTLEPFTLELEHSLISLSKWESKFEKPFLTKDPKPPEEVISYIECMILSPEYPPNFAARLKTTDYALINDYIEAKKSATTFGQMPERKGSRNETITSELIYYWLVAFNIPFEVEHWHLNRLFSLIRVCNVKNTKPKKQSAQQRAQQYRQLNAERRAALNSSG